MWNMAHLFNSVSLLLLAAFMSVPSDGHLCLISPRQRGDMDISKSGSHTCFRHGAPCGGEPSELAKQVWLGGQQAFIKWQQNYNHYDVGYPGYMDIAIAPIDSDEFMTLYTTPDVYVYAQDHQQNYTAIVTIPDMKCDHCVIRGRYQSHKQGETIFYQCADVSIIKTTKQALQIQNEKLLDNIHLKHAQELQKIRKQNPIPQTLASKYMLQGHAYNGFESDRFHFVNVSLENGNVRPLNTIQYPNSQDFLMDAIAALNPGQGEMLTIYHKGGTMDDGAKSIMVFFTINGTIETTLPLQNFDGVPISSLLYVKPRTYVSFGIQENPAQAGTFLFILGKVSYVPGTGLVYERLFRTTDPENLYVNYQWAEFDPDSGLLYVLMGNENEPDTLTARIYTFDFYNKSLVRQVEVQNGQYTFMSMQLHRESGKLYAVAPYGPYAEKRPAYDLIQVDPVSGAVTTVFDITTPGLFERYYGGTIFNGIDQDEGVLYHVLHVADIMADVILAVNIKQRTAHFSSLCNLRHIHNLSLSPL